MCRKKILVAALICGISISVVITGCSKEIALVDSEANSEIENIQLRAANLGFTDVNAYQTNVTQQCAAGNHENCCVINGTHQVCPYPDHLGVNCNGTHCNGKNHTGQCTTNCKNPDCTGFVDADGDGICDNCADTCTGTGTHPQDGTGNQHGQGHH